MYRVNLWRETLLLNSSRTDSVIYSYKFSLTSLSPLPSWSTENLLQNSVDDSWTDSNLNRVSVIQFQEETKAEDEDDEAAADRRVRKHNNHFINPLHVILLRLFNVLLLLFSIDTVHLCCSNDCGISFYCHKVMWLFCTWSRLWLTEVFVTAPY